MPSSVIASSGLLSFKEALRLKPQNGPPEFSKDDKAAYYDDLGL